MTNQWNQSGNNFYITETSSTIPLLEPGVYELSFNPNIGLYLQKTEDSFKFSHKLYGVESKFIDRVKRQYDNSTGNLGMLLNGIKGTGKTVTSKLICNNMNLPVILVNFYSGGLPDFINRIQQDVLVLIDEYEKIYTPDNASVLTVMDGVLSNGSRRIFILTTNNERINENLIQRPGRIRYRKTYGDLKREVVEEIVDDVLLPERVQHRKALIEFISCLQLITIDIVIAITKEVNIHDEPPKEFKDIFNAQQKDSLYDVVRIVNGVEYPFDEDCRPNLTFFSEKSVGKTFASPNWRGVIREYIDFETALVTYVVDREDLDEEDPNDKAALDLIEAKTTEETPYPSVSIDWTVRVKSKFNYHANFAGAF